MLQELVLSNFKTLQADVRLPLGPRLTLLLGANNTGKSNALAALRLLGQTARLQSLDRAVQSLGGAASLVTRGQARCHVRAHGVVEGQKFDQHLTFASSDVLPGGESFEEVKVGDLVLSPASPANQVRLSNGSMPVVGAGRVLAAEASPPTPAAGAVNLQQLLRSIQVFDLSVARLRQPAAYQEGLALGTDGSGLAAMLDFLSGTAPDLFEAIQDDVRRGAPEVLRLTTPPRARQPAAQSGGGAGARPARLPRQ